jgi:hypothetical protein
VWRIAGTAACVTAPRRPSAQAEALLHDGALRNDHRARREIVIVKAGVVSRQPADQPDLDLVVEPQAFEDPLRNDSRGTSRAAAGAG